MAIAFPKLTQTPSPASKRPAPQQTSTAAPATAAPPARTDEAKFDPVTGQRLEPKGEQLVEEVKSSWDQLRDPNFFGEKDKPSTSGLYGESHSRALEQLQKPSGASFVTGQWGRAMAARMVNVDQRNDGFFGDAYGKKTFRAWLAADRQLQAIPQGALADALSIELLAQVSIKSYVRGEEPLLEKLGHTLRTLQGRRIEPGTLRDYATRTTPLPKLSDEGAKAVEAHGARYQSVVGGKGVIIYPEAKGLEQQLQQLLDETKAALKDPASDGVQVASRFAQRFVALHPFQDGNGRVARLMLDRLLAEKGLPPPILRDLAQDLALTPEAYAKEVTDGIARMQKALSSSSQSSAIDYAATVYRAARAPAPNLSGPVGQPVFINDLPFALGADGFVYDMAGRPHLMDTAGALQPLSQMAYYLTIRRLAQSADPGAALDAFTKSTREAFAQVIADPSKTALPDDTKAVDADNQYRAAVPPSLASQIAAVFDPKLSTPAALFTKKGTHVAPSTPYAFALSRYAQVDQELYLMQKGLERGGDRAAASQLLQHRASLFTLAQEHLGTLEPKGATYRYEELMLEQSPLKFGSFEEYRSKRNDDKVTLWHGQTGVAKLFGIHPDSRPGRPDAFDVAELREKRGGVGNMFEELTSVGGSSGGTGFQSFTTDLSLLAKSKGFADKTDVVEVNLKALPPAVRGALSVRLQPGDSLGVNTLRDVLGFAVTGRDVPAGYVDVAGVAVETIDAAVKGSYSLDATKKQQVGDRLKQGLQQQQNLFRRMLHAVSDGQTLVKLDDLLTPEQVQKLNADVTRNRDYLTVSRHPTKEDALTVRSNRRAFRVEVDRDEGLPGPYTQGGTFEAEQEITVGKSQGRRSIEATYSADELSRKL